MSQVLPFPSTLSAAAPEFLPRYPAQMNKMASLRPGKDMLYLPSELSHAWPLQQPPMDYSLPYQHLFPS